MPSARRPAGPHWLRVRGATLHNLKGVDVDIPLGTLTAVTGVSRLGQEHAALRRALPRSSRPGSTASTRPRATWASRSAQVASLTGWELLKDVLLVDQSPIGRSPRSNPVTYIKAFDEIRELFAAQPLARQRQVHRGHLLLQPAGGRCEACEGAGHVQVEMVFLADVFVPCEACGGTRYRREVLDVRIQGHSIHDVLQWTVDEAITRFRHQPKLGAALWQLQQVGLGYLRLGQPATTLSGGEAQRLKIARELAQAGKREGRKLYILDEPTTGLHLDDVRVLIQVLDRLVDAGHTVVVIEHHLDVIKRADWVDRPGPRGRRRRRPGGGPGHARGGRRGRGVPHRPVSPAAPGPARSRGSPGRMSRRRAVAGAGAGVSGVGRVVHGDQAGARLQPLRSCCWGSDSASRPCSCSEACADSHATRLIGGLVLGGLFWAGFVFQTKGLQYTTPSRSAFITILSTPLVPLLQFLLHRTCPDRPPRSRPSSSPVAGTWLLTRSPGGGGLNRGDLLTIGCAIVFAGQIVAAGHYAARIPIGRLLALELGTSAPALARERAGRSKRRGSTPPARSSRCSPFSPSAASGRSAPSSAPNRF